MKKNKLSLADLSITKDFWLVGIQSSLEIFELVFKINQKSNSCFERAKFDLQQHDSNERYLVYKWKSEENEPPCYVFSNSYTTKSYPSELIQYNALISSTPIINTLYLLPQFNMVDFFVRVESKRLAKSFKLKMETIDDILMSFLVHSNHVKDSCRILFE